MRRSDVSAGRHRRDVGRNGDQEPGRGRAGPARADVDHDGGLGLDDPGVDRAGGVDQTARGAERQHDEIGVVGIRAVENLHDVLGRDGMDERFDIGGVHERPRTGGAGVDLSGADERRREQWQREPAHRYAEADAPTGAKRRHSTYPLVP